jgi:hypothetical protein
MAFIVRGETSLLQRVMVAMAHGDDTPAEESQVSWSPDSRRLAMSLIAMALHICSLTISAPTPKPTDA